LYYNHVMLRPDRHAYLIRQLILLAKLIFLSIMSPAAYALDNPNTPDLNCFYLVATLLILVGAATIYLYQHNRKLQKALASSHLDQLALAASEARHRLLADHASDVIWTMDLQGNFTYVSPSVAKLRGFTPAEVMAQPLDQAVTESSLPIAQAGLASVMAAIKARLPTAVFRGELEQPCKYDGSVWTEVSVTGIRNEAGEYTGLLGVSRDITERRQIEDALRESEFRWKFAIEGSGDGVWDWNIQTNEAKYSTRWKTMLGYADGDILPTNEEWQTRIHPDDQALVAATMQAYLDGKSEIYVVEYRLRCKDGSYKWILGRGMVVSRCADGQPLRMIGTHTDITERRQHEEQVRRLAFHDALTYLPNRRLFNDRLTQAIATNHRSGYYGATMFLDLDNFKPLNDIHGHEVGDLLLIEVAQRLQGCVREMDTVARFGGDEFVVMLSRLTANKNESILQAGLIAEKVRTALSAPYRLAIDHKGRAEKFVEHYCTVSIGVAMFNDHKTSNDDVIRMADAAMYQAKDAGRNLVRFVSEVPTSDEVEEANAANFVKLIWRPAYTSGNALIDEQHRLLLNDTNKLLTAILADRPKSEVSKLIGVLIVDVLKHFKDEEAILHEAEYPDALDHATIHKRIEVRAKALVERFDADSLGSGEIFQFLAHDVVARHMLGEDRKFFQYLERRG
jgi:diguanylate cyclase (GGDEF)-like protein/hemerythrin-like metal-binding protein/PAS domain S-box-containing protein